jgi:hypothetical protein
LGVGDVFVGTLLQKLACRLGQVPCVVIEVAVDVRRLDNAHRRNSGAPAKGASAVRRNGGVFNSGRRWAKAKHQYSQ